MKVRQKLTSRRGETLVETLAAILIVALSSALFLAMVSAGVRISHAGDGQMQELDRQLTVAEKAAPEDGARGQVTFRWETGGETKVEVTCYGDEGNLRSYRLKGGTSP